MRIESLDAIMGLAGDLDSELTRPKLSGFRAFILLHAAGRTWLWLRYNEYLNADLLGISAVALTACFAAALVPKLAHLAPRAALPFLVVQLFQTFPLSDNHFVLELLCVGLVALVGPDNATRADEEALVVASLKWLTAIVLFHTGLQKILYGYYLYGDFLAFMIAMGGRFADLFRIFVPPEEIARLESYDVMRTGAGPFRVDSPPFVLVSNAVYLLELALPPLLIWRQTRTLAAISAAAFILAIELGAREIGFALLFVNLLLLFFPIDLNKRLLPLFAAVYLYGLAAALGLAPGGDWLQPGYL